MYPVHIVPKNRFFLQGADAHAPIESGLVRGIEAEAPHHLHGFVPPAREGALQPLQGGGVLLQGGGGVELDIVSVGHAVKVQQQLVPLDLLVPPGKVGGAEEALLLVVEEHEADPVPVFLRQS